MPPINKIERDKAHILEQTSQREFEAIIQPWFALEWTRQDYGIDSFIQLATVSEKTGKVYPEGKVFMVQLKSRTKLLKVGNNIHLSVPVKNLILWFESNFPFLLVAHDAKTNKFYYLWIDQSVLIALEQFKRNWQLQKTITVKISCENGFVDDFHQKLRDYIFNYKRPTRKDIKAGQFFEYQEQCIALVNDFQYINSKFSFSSALFSIDKFKKEIQQCIYRIAIVGLSRVGKSSLINSLLKTYICPVGIYQTTSVPIQITPGNEEAVHIYFHHKPTLKIPYSPEGIKEYASQDGNSDNVKQVSLVSVSVLTEQLQRGISLFDIPGLNDPDDVIASYSMSVAKQSNAIFYVIDATPAQNGGYIFQRDFKDHISSFGASIDKIFLVFNKVDSVPPERLKDLKERVQQDLTKYGLYDKIGAKVYYITTETDKAREDLDSIDKLEEDVWTFVLNGNKFGVYRLAAIMEELVNSAYSFVDLLAVRALDGQKREDFNKKVESIKAEIDQLNINFYNRINDFKKRMSGFLENGKNEILIRLQKWLQSIHHTTAFASDSEVRFFLRSEFDAFLTKSNNEYVVFLSQQKQFIDNWVESHLKQLREVLSGSAGQRIFQIDEIDSFALPNIDLSSPIGIAVTAWGVTYLINPAFAAAAFIVAAFSSLVTGSEAMRAKRVTRTLEKSRSVYDSSFKKLWNSYVELLEEETSKMEEYANRKLALFFSDIDSQIQKLQTPMTQAEADNYESALFDIRRLQKDIGLLRAELLSYTV